MKKLILILGLLVLTNTYSDTNSTKASLQDFGFTGDCLDCMLNCIGDLATATADRRAYCLNEVCAGETVCADQTIECTMTCKEDRQGLTTGDPTLPPGSKIYKWQDDPGTCPNGSACSSFEQGCGACYEDTLNSTCHGRCYGVGLNKSSPPPIPGGSTGPGGSQYSH